MIRKDVHIGTIIDKVSKERGFSATQLAEILCCDRSCIYRMFKHKSIDTDLLVTISNLLNYDFFAEYSSPETRNNRHILIVEVEESEAEKLLSNPALTVCFKKIMRN
jgi:hypothetical protein